MRTVLCMKWGTKYGPEYVNRLYAMVRRHLAGDFRFVCLTDDGAGLRPEVQSFPIPEMKLAAHEPERGWKKLLVFASPLYDIQGPVLFLDVDVVVTADLQPLFDAPGEFFIIHDWKRPWRLTGNSSVFRFECGSLPEVLSYFETHSEQVKRRFRNEQAYLSEKIHQMGKLQYWPDSWCVSWKYHCIPRFPSNYWRMPLAPQQARVLVFHGVVNPPDALAGRRNGNWRYARPAPWLAQHWRE